MPLALIVRMFARGNLVRQIPAEIDLGSDEPAVSHRMHLTVAEALAVRCTGFVHDEGTITVLGRVDILDARHGRAVWPANVHISRAIE